MEHENIYSISEVGKITGFKPHVIRFYEKEFNLTIPREENNRRYFTNREIEELLYIKKLKDEGKSNKQVKKILNNDGNMENKNTMVKANTSTGWTVRVAEMETASENSKEDALVHFKNDILNILEEYNYKDELSGLKDKIEELKHELNVVDNTKDKDVLICENAKLKLKVKEKSYEIAALKDRLKREEKKKTSIFKRLLRTKSASL